MHRTCSVDVFFLDWEKLLIGHVQLQHHLVTVQHAHPNYILSLPLSAMRHTCSVDVFFLDWEKPRRVLAKGGGKEEAAPVSCWRTLLVANEWNELQASGPKWEWSGSMPGGFF